MSQVNRDRIGPAYRRCDFPERGDPVARFGKRFVSGTSCDTNLSRESGSRPHAVGRT